jgi:hypothetical protein
MARDNVKNYFKKFPKWTIWMIVIGIPLLFAYGLGLLFIGLGILGIVLFSKKKVTDQQYDAILEEDFKQLAVTALNKTGTDASEVVSEAVTISGPKLWDTAGAEIHYKKGKDNQLRFTPMAVTTINFTPNQLLVYSAVYDVITGKCLNESTDEYFYKDVVSVSTKTESKTITSTDTKIGTVQMNAAESFTLTTSGGTSISIILSDPSLIEKMGGGEIPKTRAEKAIQTVRKMLREKKSN